MAKRSATAAAASPAPAPRGRPSLSREQVKAELEQIRERSPDKRLHPKTVAREVRRDPGHVLRGYFTEDMSEAAQKRWEDEARKLIRWVRVAVVEIATAPRVPAYVSLLCDRPTGGGYRPTSQVMDNADLLQSLKETAIAELQGWVKRYAQIKNDIHDEAMQILGLPPTAAMPDIAHGD